ncbi:MAG: hypothetical protein LBE34_01360 [Flavobacteriaceae bacterium]|jgi:hypothetical protein|nr:hypothetical protein [Flavobacteriaceae bacterium]
MKTRAMFNFTKTVLENVSFEPKLFYKEIRKAIKQLVPYDVDELNKWVSEYVQGRPELEDSLELFNV